MPNAAPGHVIGGCEEFTTGTTAEKKLVYEKLAGLIDRIINPVDRVIAMGGDIHHRHCYSLTVPALPGRKTIVVGP
jgi:hypothetical protein